MSNSLSLEGAVMHPEELEFGVGSCRFRMIKVEGGTFTMGATEEGAAASEVDERPAHQVTLSDYYIGQTQVTQALWTAVMGDNPSWSLFHRLWQDLDGNDPSELNVNNLPVENVAWDDCQTFIEKLNRLLFNELGEKRFALPTEAQWEFAARGGNKSKGYKYAGSNDIHNVAWYRDNSGDTHPVAQKLPNELRLYDMSGNVWEWCQDWYDEGYYRISPENNPQGPADGKWRVMRGGGWDCDARFCRVSNRSFSMSSDGIGYFSLRICLIP